ncbi:MaoC family dehydratase [Actinomadura madurae]|uniref:MaoC family dehydratase n=1 Tax=Actinomadura madurae TaxID=1993 RepID=UPI0026E59408|nr:MaoC family dehydratase [Actinomadura madurae]
MSTTVAFEDLKSLAGASLGSSRWLEVGQDRINLFADATGDHQWIHVDPERAKKGPFGGPIAHGYLTLSLVIPLWTELLDVTGVTTKVNYGLDRVRFPAPVPAGARIRLSATLAEVSDVARRRRPGHRRPRRRDRERRQARLRPAGGLPLLPVRSRGPAHGSGQVSV